jgi:hypothetical protein
MREYSKGGRTDITVLTLACDPDHAQIHDGETEWITEIIREGTGPPGWPGRVGRRQRGTLDRPRPNNTHFPEKYFTNPQMWNPDSQADAEWFAERARTAFENKHEASVAPVYAIEFGWNAPRIVPRERQRRLRFLVTITARQAPTMPATD